MKRLSVILVFVFAFMLVYSLAYAAKRPARDRTGDNLGNTAPPVILDADLDGYISMKHGGDDCNDHNAAIHPGAVEICGNQVDENCDLIIEDCPDFVCGNAVCEEGEGVHNCLEDCGPLVVDHTAVDLFDQIPDYYIDLIRSEGLLLQLPGQSHSSQIVGDDTDPDTCPGGLRLLQQQDPKYAVEIECKLNDLNQTNVLRVVKGRYQNGQWRGDWKCRSGEESYWSRESARTMTENSVEQAAAQGDPIFASGFLWCWDIIKATNCYDENNVLKTYDDERELVLENAIERFNQNEHGTKFMYTTSPTDDDYANHQGYIGPDGYRVTNYHDQIRAAAIENKGILLDLADIENWNNTNTAQRIEQWNGHDLYLRHTDYDGGTCGHSNNLLHIRKAKAIWYMLARLAGWDG